MLTIAKYYPGKEGKLRIEDCPPCLHERREEQQRARSAAILLVKPNLRSSSDQPTSIRAAMAAQYKL